MKIKVSFFALITLCVITTTLMAKEALPVSDFFNANIIEKIASIHNFDVNSSELQIYDIASEDTKKINLSNVDKPYKDYSVTHFNGELYLAILDNNNDYTIYKSIQNDSWQEIAQISNDNEVTPVLAIQHDGAGNQLFLFSTDIYKIDLLEYNVTDLNVQLDNKFIFAIAVGQSDIVLLDEQDGFYIYHTITSTLRQKGVIQDLEASYKPLLAKIKYPEDSLQFHTASTHKFGIINYVVLIVYLLILLIMGFYFSKRENTTNDFFLAGGRVPWWAAGLSIFGTQLSAITFMAVPAKVYSSNWHYFFVNMGIVIVAAPVTCFLFIPFFRGLKVTTAYEYLEKRYHVSLRLFASVIYILSQLVRMGVVVFLPSIALSTVTGINLQFCIVLMGVLCTIYTVLGGIEAVIWTDVVQVIVLLCGAIFCICLVLVDVGKDIPVMMSEAFSAGKFSLGQPEMDFFKPTLIVVILSGLVVFIPYVSDQTVVQRYLTTKDANSAKKSIWTNAILAVPSTFLFFGLGTALYFFYKKNPGLLDVGMSNDSILPWFIVNSLPQGISGLVIAGIFAAAMSSLDSSMNSVSSAVANDFIIRFRKGISEHKQLLIARLLTLLFGLFGTITALIMSFYNIKSIWDCFSASFGMLVGSLGAIFLLGVITKRASTIGVFSGALLGLAVTYYIQTNTELYFLLYMPIGFAVAFISGYIFSLIFRNKKDLTGVTIYSLPK